MVRRVCMAFLMSSAMLLRNEGRGKGFGVSRCS
jgi:hypothetical protein